MRAAVMSWPDRPIRNVHTNPKANRIGYFFRANAATISLDPTGILVECTPGATDSGVGYPNACRPGIWSYAMEVEAITAATLRLSVQSATAGGGSTTPVAMTAGEIRRLAIQVNHTDTATASVYVLRGHASGSERFIVRSYMHVEGVYTGPYRDGDSPGWSWAGAVGWSTSSGPAGR